MHKKRERAELVFLQRRHNFSNILVFGEQITIFDSPQKYNSSCFEQFSRALMFCQHGRTVIIIMVYTTDRLNADAHTHAHVQY